MSEQQTAYLKAMGIDVWLEKSPPIPLQGIESEHEQAVHTSIEEFVTESKPKPETTLNNIEYLDWPDLLSTVAECQRCKLSKNRTRTIFGSGNNAASLMIIGDAPGEEDEAHGEPFAGDSGKLLTAMLKAMGFQRKDVYISNLVKCRISKNQELSVEEVAACESYLTRQIKLLQPDLILALGSVTAQRLLKSKSTLGRMRGQLHYIEHINVPVIVSFDPAYLLRSPNEKRKAWDDLQLAMKELATITSLKEASYSGKETPEKENHK